MMALVGSARGTTRHIPYRDSKLTFLLRVRALLNSDQCEVTGKKHKYCNKNRISVSLWTRNPRMHVLLFRIPWEVTPWRTWLLACIQGRGVCVLFIFFFFVFKYARRTCKIGLIPRFSLCFDRDVFVQVLWWNFVHFAICAKSETDKEQGG